MIRKAGILVFLILLVSSSFAQNRSMKNLVDQYRLDFYFYPVAERFLLSKGTKSVTGQIKNPYLVYKDLVFTEAEIQRSRNDLVMNEDTYNFLASYFTREELSPSRIDSLPEVAVIIIDPGHGGKDSGARRTYSTESGSVTIEEKDIVLDVSLELYERLKKKYPDKSILLTRKDDSYPSLEERVYLANQQNVKDNQAIIYISIHINASLNPKSTGFEVWHLPTDFRREVLDKRSLDTEEQQVYSILNNMMEDQFFVEGIILAQNILENLEGQIQGFSENRGLKEQSWYVVRKANMPSVLVELGFISNKEEALLLMDSSYLNKLTTGLYNGITQFISYFEKTKGFAE